MMTNLFSAFDPATTQAVSMNWVSTIMVLLLLPQKYWLMSSRSMCATNKIFWTLNGELKSLLETKTTEATVMFVALFMFIFSNNVMGLLPYVFTSSSHMAFTLTLALPLWVSLMIFGWMNHTNKMFAHLIPTGTPAVLMPFMTMIETISNIMRPGSLAVRLAANMIAGHLLMTLLGNKTPESGLWAPLLISAQTALMMFEAAVSVIQAYVFSVLGSLYYSEIK
uniref:ATP synthase subunit a n=1 Tax=Aradus compar TaxID=1176475 RepID=A0A171LG09_9HEMI|nr:ATP synthase F0 subunit 6 [Aradus compar]AFI54706.1 ATP synthase F0 subunit 6 [Aradus compar]